MKKKILFAVLLILVLGAIYFYFSGGRDINVLVFSKTNEYRHESISAGKQAIIQLGQKHNFLVDTTEDALVFNEKTLQNYNVVIFLNTTGEILNDAQQLEFNRVLNGLRVAYGDTMQGSEKPWLSIELPASRSDNLLARSIDLA